MNCNLNGTDLTVDDLLAIAVADGQDTRRVRDQIQHFHNDALARSLLLTKTARARQSLFARGLLRLDTRPVSTVRRPVGHVDPDVLAFYLASSRRAVPA